MGEEFRDPRRTMRVARLWAAGDIRVADEPMAAPRPGHSLVRVTTVGICGSDLHWYGEGAIGDARLDRPLVIGHEIAGVVQDGPLDGRRVAVDPAIPCGNCRTCLSGDRNLCPAVVFAGHGGCDGGLRGYLSWPTELLHELPGGVSDVDGALLEPLGVAVHAADLGHPRIGGSVGVFGCGPIGLLLVRLARLGGATRVIAADPLEHRRAAALHYGADEVLDPSTELDVDGLAVDLAFEVAGTDAALDAALRAVRPGARVVLVGIPDDDRVGFRASLARRKGLTLVLARRMNDVYPRAIELVARGLVDTGSLVTAAYPLDQVAAAFTDAATRTGLKVVVRPDSVG
jgi:L-iditol 2-dehydrogenase